MIDRFSPATVAPPFSRYSHGVEVPAGARVVVVAGQVGVYPDGTTAEGIAAQTERALLNIAAILEQKGMGLADLVETRTYMTDPDDLPGYREGRARAFATCAPAPCPAAALVFVAGLAQPQWKIEICAMAAKV